MEWAPTVRKAVRLYVAKAIERLDPARYYQEPAYVAALLARLDGVVYQGRYGRVEIRSTIVADRGPNSAEYRWGCDFAMVALLRNARERIEKAVLAQAKKASIPDLTGKKLEDFLTQCKKMSDATNSTLALEVPRSSSDGVLIREITLEERKIRWIKIGGKFPSLPIQIGQPRPLADYIVGRLLPCEHGDSNPNFIREVNDSKLTHLAIMAESYA